MPASSLVIITGSSRGLGEALALQYMAQGVPVIAVARGRSDALDQKSHETGGALTQIQADLSNADQTEKAARQITRLIPAGLNRCILINNAGTVQPVANSARLNDATTITAALTLNVTSLIRMSAAVLDAVNPDSDCRILNISSGAGRSPMPGWGVYCASKAAVDMATQVLAQEHPGVRTASLAPGVIDTGMQQTIRASDKKDFPSLERFLSLHNEGQLASPADTARHIIQYLERDDFGTTVLDDIRNYF